MDKHKQSTFMLSLQVLITLIVLYIAKGLIDVGTHTFLMAIFNNFDFPKWVYIYAYFNFIMMALIIMWCVYLKSTKFIVIYMVITILIDFGIVCYFFSDHILAMLKKVFPFLYWGN